MGRPKNMFTGVFPKWHLTPEESIGILVAFLAIVLLHHLFRSFWSTIRHIAKGEQTHIIALRYTHDGCAQALAQRCKSQPKKFLHVGLRDIRDRIGDKAMLPKLAKAKPEQEFLQSQQYSFRPVDKRSEAQLGHDDLAYWWDYNPISGFTIAFSDQTRRIIHKMFDDWITECNRGKNVIVDLSDLDDQLVGAFVKKCKTKLVRGTDYTLVEAYRSGQVHPGKKLGKCKPHMSVDQFGVSGPECARRIFRELRDRQIAVF